VLPFIRSALQDLVERHPSLQPGESRTQTEMQAITEGHVVVYRARDVEPVTIGRLPIVAAPGTVQQQDGASCTDDPTIAADVLSEYRAAAGRIRGRDKEQHSHTIASCRQCPAADIGHGWRGP
jgi:hypothetical protein